MAACIFKPAVNLAESVEQFHKGGAPQIFKIIRRSKELLQVGTVTGVNFVF